MLSPTGRFGSLLIYIICTVLIILSLGQLGLSPTSSIVVESEETEIINKASSPSTARSDIVTFTNVTPTTGLNGISGNFFAWGDYNNDGNQDLLVNGGRLFKNIGPPDYSFIEVTGSVGLSGGGNGAWATAISDSYSN